MQSVQAEMWDPQPPSKHASPLPPHPPSNLRPARVTTGTPAKRITFYKSGDSQFGGIRMAIHKRSFKCFDALLDDLSQKVPLPFGVRTVTTPRGTHAIKQLEQLQDGGCYLCSDRRQAKPVNMELASKRPNIWYHHSRRPQRPESSSTTPPGHFSHRQRRILLVKNSEPGMRRSVMLSRRLTRSLRAFLDEVSEVMQFHVRKLYTVEGRRIDSVQGLITCPGVLVCVGREAFSPLLVNFIRKSSEEKLPGLGSRSPGLGPRTPGNGARSPATQGARSPPHGAQSRASEYSEGHESKKNVNFGLETKKSIIHPRSDSSNRSTRFSLSSEKSYGNGVSAYQQARPTITNDDIEKRVLVNKDGSLSVEMRVRFRLHNDETLQWSTQVKKSQSLTNGCCPPSQAQPHYMQQGQSESCSDPDSASFDPDSVLEGNCCPCCYQRPEQQYDLWENPAHSHKKTPVPPPYTSSHTHTMMRHTHSSSSSSSCNSRRVVRCRARVSNCGGESEQSQLVQEEMFVTEQVEVEQDKDTHVEVCRVSQCCSRSEVVARKSVEDDLIMEEEVERPLSTVSSSSHVLQSLKEDQDDDLSHSASQCCHSNEPSPSPTSQTHLNDNPTGNETGSRAASTASNCQCGAATPHPSAEAEEMDRAPSSKSKTSCRSDKAKIPNSEEEEAANDEDEEIKRAGSGLSGHTGVSLQSRASSVCLKCGGCKRGVNSDSNSRASQKSPKPSITLSSHENANNGSDDEDSEDSAVSTQSNKTNLTNDGRCSAVSYVLEGGESGAMSRTSNPEAAGQEEERAPSVISATSHRSNRSHKSGCKGSTCGEVDKEERSPSVVSAQSNKSHKSNCSGTAESPAMKTLEQAEGENTVERAQSSLSAKSGASSAKIRAMVASPTDNTAVEDDASGKAERSDSVLSAKSAKSNKSNVSTKSGTSHRSTCSHCVRAVLSGAEDGDGPEETGQEVGIEGEERAATAMSAKSNLSAKSNKSTKSTKAPERPLSSRSETGDDEKERAESQVSGKSNVSCKSSKSCKSNCNGDEIAGSPNSEENVNEMVEDEQPRPESAISAKSVSSAKSHHTNCDTSTRVVSPPKDTEEDRIPSAMSAKSHTSAKSSKSQKSNRATASPNPNGANIPSIETNREEEQSESEERVASVMSKSSGRSRTSHKSGKILTQNIVTIKTPEVVDEDGNETSDRAHSAASNKSGKSNNVEDDAPRSKSHGQMLSPRRARTRSPSSPQSPVQQLLPGGETRGPSALSVHSTISAKSGKSKCRCGTASAKDGEKKEDNEELNNEEASERAASILSSSTKRRRRESGGTEQPLCRNSSGSISLGLPDDQDTADSDSGKSCASFHTNTERKGRGKTATPKVPESATKEERERMESTMSQNSKSTHSRPAVAIPTIETPGGNEYKGEEGGELPTERGASVVSSKSTRSHKSCNCQMLDVKPKAQRTSASPTKAGNDVETGSVKSGSTTKASNMDTPDNRTSSSLASAEVGRKSPASASANNANVAGSSGDNDADTQAISRPVSEAEGKEETADDKSVHSKSRKGEGSVKAKSSGSVKTSTSQKKETKSSNPCPLHSPRPRSKAETQSESILSHSLSAADMLKEAITAERSHSRQSKVSKTSDKSKSKRCQKSRNQADQEELELSPACLPNASPNEVVSDWLRSIPANSCMLALGDEEEQGVEEKPGEEVKEGPTGEKVETEEDKQKEENAECDAAEEEQSPDPAPGDAVRGGSRPENLLLNSDSLPRSLHSSAAVMKVLLSSSLGRCQSMPEVSPVYGRRLSTSARGLLGCLAQLQLIEPAGNPGFDSQKDRRYEDIMSILQSLWLTEPRNTETKDVGTEQVSPPRSSSGVGMSSGSGGSGKENEHQGGDETTQNKTKEGEEEEKGGNEEAGHKETEETNVAEEQTEEQSTIPPSLDSPKATESSANDSSKSPTDNEQETLEDSSSGTPPTVLRAPLSKRLSQDPDPVWVLHLLKKLEKQFMNHYISAMAEFKVRWDLDDSLILDTMIGELRDEVSRRIQKSIESEVRKIQGRAGRGGRLPRPPDRGTLSRESTMTEKRRRILKVMKNQSVKTAESLSDGETTGDFSDQRSDDEYCPCDACIRKKMAARPLKVNPSAAEAPVMMEFDLLKILQRKKSPSPAPVPQPAEAESDSEVADSEVRSLEVVQEEEEETKEDIKADVVLEETIAEEEEEIEKEEDGGEVAEEEREVDAEKEESSTGDEVQEDGKTSGEEAGEEETSENGEEEEEADCQCQCARDEEGEEETAGEDAEGNSDNTGEDETGDDGERTGEEDEETGTGEEEEESDKETVREVKASDGETTENTEDVEEEEAEKDECEVCEFTEQEGQESTEEEASGETEDDGAAENEESTPVEEIEGGNNSASAEAEDEDDGDDAAREDDSNGDEKGGESEEQGGAASEEEGASAKGVTVTEGEEADAEDSDTDGKRPSDTSADESGREEAGATGDEEVDAVEEFTPEEEEEEVNKQEVGALQHQFTKSSVESQPGSLDDINADSPQKTVNAIEVPTAGVSAGGGAGQRRSRSPGRVKCRKPKESDVDLEDF